MITKTWDDEYRENLMSDPLWQTVSTTLSVFFFFVEMTLYVTKRDQKKIWIVQGPDFP